MLSLPKIIYTFTIIIMEKWKDIQWYEWLYQVSNLWNIKSLDRVVFRKNWRKNTIKWRILKQWKTGNSYHNRVTLQKTDWKFYKFLVHRLVYCTFNNIDIKQNNNWSLVLHKNDIYWDNRLSNLYLWTHKDNWADRIKNKKIKNNILLK